MNKGHRHSIIVCYFGIFNPEYSRNRIFIKGLKKQGVEVFLCVSNRQGPLKYFDLMRKHWRIRNRYDAMVVGYPGQQSAIIARVLTRKPIIFDALVSLNDSMVDDRAVLSKKSLGAYYYWCIDYLACHLADVVLVDTNAHKEYFVRMFHLLPKKVMRIFIGSDDDVVYPLPHIHGDGAFRVHFHGCFNPLQGVDVIVRAAKILEYEPIEFTLIGNGQTFDAVRSLSAGLQLRRVTFIDNVPYEHYQ